MDAAIRDLLQLALHSVRDYAVVLLDPDGTIIGWLCGAEEILGYSASEIVGKPSQVLFTPEDVDKMLHTHELEIARRDSSAQDDRWHLRSDGTRIWVSGAVTALRDANGVRGFIKILRDRTDMRMNSENRALRLDAMQETVARTHRFLRTLGHEMRNPLAPIKTAAYIVQHVGDDPRVRKAADAIALQVGVLERLTGNLVDVAHLHDEDVELHLAELDIRTLVEETVSGQRLPAVAKGVRLEPILPGAPIPVTVDADRLRQAITHLLINAIHYTPAGGRIWVKATQEGDDVVVRVQDTGIGIAPEVLPRIFELFTREPPGGLGVGLTIVRQIAELHGGVAQARSGGAGRGAEFTLRLPRRGPAGDARESSSV